MNSKIKDILNKGKLGNGLSTSEALYLLENIKNSGDIFDELLNNADFLNRKFLGSIGEVHGQIGLNWDTCSKKCQFCTFSEELNNIHQASEISKEELIKKSLEFEELGVGSISIMATADYDFDRFLDMGRAVSNKLVNNTPLFGNWGDLSLEQAKQVKDAGYSFYYHALRLREGEVTGIDKETRINTIKNAHQAGLLVGSCLEPIGPEHTYEEIIELLEIMKELDISWMATMKRIPTENSPLVKYGEITTEEFAKITAVTRLYFGKSLFTMAAHEPSDLLLKAGANFLVAESGTNPRDSNLETSDSRGLDVATCYNMFKKHNYKVYSGSVNERYYKLSQENTVDFHKVQLSKNLI